MKKTLKTLKGHTYGGKFRKPGDVYKANRTDANLMVLLKRSEYFTEVVIPPVIEEKPKRTYTRRKATYQTKVETAE